MTSTRRSVGELCAKAGSLGGCSARWHSCWCWPGRKALHNMTTAAWWEPSTTPTGAAVPNATVTITNTATGVSSVVTTSASGDYEVPSLRVGVYTITATRSGIC